MSIYNIDYMESDVHYYLSITDEYTVNENRDYVTSIMWNSVYTWVNSVAGNVKQTGFPNSNTGIDQYSAILQRSNGSFLDHNGGDNSNIEFTVESDNRPTETHYNNIIFPVPQGWAVNVGTKTVMCTVSTNVPIFLKADEAYYNIYRNSSKTDLERLEALTHAINYKNPLEGEEQTYEYSVIARNYTMDELGNLTENTSEGEVYRGFRIKSKFPTSLYKIPGITDGALKIGINYHDAIACYYSTDYGNTWQMIPGQPTSLPFDFTYRVWEEADGAGTFWAAVGGGDNKNLLIFDNEEDSNEYNHGLSDGRKASNYGEIMNGDFDNPTGEENDETEFGEVYTRGFFSQQYIMSSGSLQALANDLFDTTTGGIWEDIKKGLDMYGANPMDAVMGLSFFPLELTSIYSTSPSSHVWFGGYGWEATGGTCNRIIAPNGYKTLGSIAIRRTFRNWRDYAPYTRLYVSLPYCGVYELDLNRYYDKTVEVRYFFDTRTNGCIACLIADGHLMDYYNGQIGVTMPITLTDFSNYANSQIQTLLGFGGQAASTGINAASSAGQLAAAGTGAAALGIAGAGIAGATIGAKAVYGLSQNNINKFNVTKGGSSSMINEYLPQYVEFTFEIQEDCAPDNYGQLYGYPSMKSGSVGSFSGFLKCQSVKLNCANATEAERNEIKQLLMSGIYI